MTDLSLGFLQRSVQGKYLLAGIANSLNQKI
jgi:hypothetical protein